jgi:hypothetical protein
VFTGFYPAVSGRWRGEADYPAPLILQIHVFTFAAWLCRLTTQVLLIRARQPAWHRKAGATGAVLIPVLVITGVGAEAYSQRFYSPRFPANLRFFLFPLVAMLSFIAVGIAGGTVPRGPARSQAADDGGDGADPRRRVQPLVGDAIYEVLGDAYFGTLARNAIGPDLMIAGLAGYDLVTRGRIHPAIMIAAPLVAIGQLAATAVYHSEWWPGVARALVGL